MPVTASPSLLMQELLAQFDQFVAGGGQDWDLTVVAAFVVPANRSAEPCLRVMVHTAGGMSFEVQAGADADVAIFLTELAKLPERPPVAKDSVLPLVLH